MKKPRTKKPKPTDLADLAPEVEKFHFNTDDEIVALIQFYIDRIYNFSRATDRRQLRYEVIRNAERLLRLARELP